MATGISPFSLVYGTENISPMELMVPTTCTLQGQELEIYVNMCAEAWMVNLETMDEMRNIAREKIRQYRQQNKQHVWAEYARTDLRWRPTRS